MIEQPLIESDQGEQEPIDASLIFKAARGIESLFKGLRSIWMLDPDLGPQAIKYLAANESLTGPMILHTWIVECERQSEQMLIRINDLIEGRLTIKGFSGSYLGEKKCGG